MDENTEVTLKYEAHREHRFAIQDQALVAPNNLAEDIPSDHSIVYQDRGTRPMIAATFITSTPATTSRTSG